MYSVTLFYTIATFIFAIAPHVWAAPHHAFSEIASRTPEQDIDTYLTSHNVIRAIHNATALEWSKPLALKARFWAGMCRFQHSGGILSSTTYGENIAAGSGDFPIEAAVATFVSDEDQYDPANPSYLRFTQVVWKSTTEVGCAANTCIGLFKDQPLTPVTMYVCLYNPAGNIIGKALENVQVQD
ncbi:CAP domain-containing protein [Panaeolus papilionaceus]|nr:CAP domain-containing protein [Panaeolus papilionaceus]